MYEMKIFVAFPILFVEILFVCVTCMGYPRCTGKEIWFECGYYSTTTALPATKSAQIPTTVWTTQPVTTKAFKTLTSQSSKLISTTPATWSPTTMTKTVGDKTVNPTEIAKNGEPLLRQVTKCDKNEGTITGLGIFAFISLIANVILSILLSRCCRQRSGENDTTPFYKNEPANASKKDQTEMYADLQYTDDISAYQTLARGNDAVYTNSLNL